MTPISSFSAQSFPVASLAKRMAVGAALALLLISLFLAGVKHPNPSWPSYWMIRPLLIVPIAGALGGGFFYAVRQWGPHETWKKVLATLVGILGYLVAVWMGTILGLDGTLWN